MCITQAALLANFEACRSGTLCVQLQVALRQSRTCSYILVHYYYGRITYHNG